MNINGFSEIVSAAFIIIGTVIAVWLARIVLNTWGKRLAHATKNRLDDTVMNALRLPIYIGVVLLGVQLLVNQVAWFRQFDTTVTAAIIYLIYWLLGYITVYRLTVNLSTWYQSDVAYRTETQLDEQIMPFFRRLTLVIVSIIAVIMLMGHFKVNTGTISAFITTLGIGSLAIALAAQTTLGDVFSGVMIMVDRPFRIGDRIELRELQTWGNVTDIGLRSTRILTRDNRLVIVPNSVIASQPIVNHSIPNTMYRVQTEVGVAYGLNVDAVRNVLVDAVRAQDWVMSDKPVEALFLEFQDSGLLFRVRCWINNYEETRRTLDKLNTCIYHALADANMEIPFPQRVVYLQKN